MLTREFTHAGQVDRVTIIEREGGWDLREERNDRLVRTVRYTDWHRVERAMRIFEVQRSDKTSGVDSLEPLR